MSATTPTIDTPEANTDAGAFRHDGVENLVIVGSGPAGWTAAIYAARAALRPLVFPGRATGKDVIPGGQLMLTTDVENFPGFPKGIMGPEMMHQFFHQALRFGTRVVTDDGIKMGDELGQQTLYHPFQNVAKIDLSIRPFRILGDGGTQVRAHSVIVATGAKANWLGLPNELRLAQIGGGVSACAVCDGALPLFRGQELAVVGGGDSAVEEANYLSKFASRVYLLHRREELRASKIMQDRVFKNPKIQVLFNVQVLDVLGDTHVTGVRLQDRVTGEQRTLPLKGLFMGIGHTPITQFLEGQLELVDGGYVKVVDPAGTATSVDGVFAAGDVADHRYRQAITAAAMGCKAAIDAERWLVEHDLLDHKVPQAGWTDSGE